MKKSFLLLSLALLPCRLPAQEIKPANAAETEAAAVRDKLSSSLFFRGELADKIMESGTAGRFVDLEGVETYSGARGLLLDWIRKNPGKAAEVYLGLKGSGGKLHQSIETREMTWEFNPSFLEAVKALNAAAGSAAVSREAMELAARRLYGGPQEDADAPVIGDGGVKSGGRGPARKDYADFRLNKGALEGELARAAGWMEAARAEGGRPGVKDSYDAAFSVYQEFLVAAAALKGRAAMTAQESSRLESLRSALRASLRALSMRARLAELDAAEAALSASSGEPGNPAMLAGLKSLRPELEALALRAANGGAGDRELAGLVAKAEKKFAGFYLAYSVYDGLLNLKKKAAPGGFSCLYDYAVYRYLAAYFPDSPYPKARAELAAASGALDEALAMAGAGDLERALGAAEPARLEAASAAQRSASSFNRAAQFLMWGLFFRPVELKVASSGGRLSHRPVFTISEVLNRGR